MKKTSGIKATHWKRLKKLKQKRNELMKYHKRHWLENQFDEHRLQWKEGWHIAAEVEL